MPRAMCCSACAVSPRRAHSADVSFDLHGGEVLGLVGLQGSGTSEVLRALAGQFPHVTRRDLLQGEPIRPASAAEAIRRRIAYVPADRQGEGLFAPMSVRENAGLLLLSRLAAALGWVPNRSLDEAVREMVHRFQIRTASLIAPVSSLSGGNQQKVVIARSLSQGPLVILLDDPTRGIDVGAKAEVHQILERHDPAGPRRAPRLLRAAGSAGHERPRAGHVRRPHHRGAAPRGRSRGSHATHYGGGCGVTEEEASFPPFDGGIRVTDEPLNLDLDYGPKLGTKTDYRIGGDRRRVHHARCPSRGLRGSRLQCRRHRFPHAGERPRRRRAARHRSCPRRLARSAGRPGGRDRRHRLPAGPAARHRPGSGEARRPHQGHPGPEAAGDESGRRGGDRPPLR